MFTFALVAPALVSRNHALHYYASQITVTLDMAEVSQLPVYNAVHDLVFSNVQDPQYDNIYFPFWSTVSLKPFYNSWVEKI